MDRYDNEPIMGAAEIARFLGVTTQRASELGGQDNFPRPVAHLKAGRVWRRADVERFAREWERKPGNPGKYHAKTT